MPFLLVTILNNFQQFYLEVYQNQRYVEIRELDSKDADIKDTHTRMFYVI